MPANLTPQYLKAEAQYRRAQSAQECIDCLENMLQLIPKHKGTDRLQGELRAKLKEAREELQAEKSAPKAGKSFKIPRQGAGTVVVVGAPNSGKSRLLGALTKAQPEVAAYPFTTREPMPGMMAWRDIQFQLIDTPPVTSSHLEPYLTGFVRSADLVLLCFDGSSDDAPQESMDVVEQFSRRKTQLSATTGFHEDDFSIVKVKSLIVVTRSADPDLALRWELFEELHPPELQRIDVDFDDPASVDGLREAVASALDIIRVYTKRPGKPADLTSPFTLPVGANVEDLAEKVHRELVASLKYAKVWKNGQGDPQSVGREAVLEDTDVVELHTS